MIDLTEFIKENNIRFFDDYYQDCVKVEDIILYYNLLDRQIWEPLVKVPLYYSNEEYTTQHIFTWDEKLQELDSKIVIFRDTVYCLSTINSSANGLLSFKLSMV